VAQLDQFALHTAMPQAGLSVARRITSFLIVATVDGRPGRRRFAWSHLRATSRCQARSVAGVTANTSVQRWRGQPGQGREPEPIGQLVADPAGLAAQHRVLVPEHQQFGVLGRTTPGEQRQSAEQEADEQAGDREDHPAMI